jgi:hypothetical protein
MQWQELEQRLKEKFFKELSGTMVAREEDEYGARIRR